MKPKTIAFAALGFFVTLFLCLGLVAGSFLLGAVIVNRSDQAVAEEPGLPIIEDSLEETPSPEVTEAPDTPIGADVDLNPLFEPFWLSWEILHDDYVDQPLDDEAMAQGALDGLRIALRQAGVDLNDVSVPSDAPSVESLSAEADTPEDLRPLFTSFWENWRRAEYTALGEDLTYEQLMQAALRGMVDSLGDPYTSYLDPQEYRQLNIPLEGEYEGIGAWVDPTGDYLRIIAPMEGSPAEAAGLEPGDTVTAVDGQDMTGVDGNIVIQHILGPEGSQVVLTIEREGVPEPFDVEITRARIVIPSVEGEMLEEDIAYVRLFNFSDGAEDDLREVLEDLLSQNPKGLILDLRNNGGGFLHTAVNVTSEFIADGVVLYEEYGDGSRDVHEARSGGLATDIPLVVLVNQGTASASEILAGAVQDYGRGLLVGTTTFGKGSVQLPVNLGSGDGALRVTVAQWLTPEERQIHEQGLEPDVIVEITDEDILAGVDPQLEKAIELLLD